MKKIFEKKFQRILFGAVFVLGILLQTIALSIPFKSDFGEFNVWWTANFMIDYPYTIACTASIILFALNAISCVVFYILSIFKKPKIIRFGVIASAIFPLIMLLLFAFFGVSNGTGIFCLVLDLIFAIAGLVYYILLYIKVLKDEELKEDVHEEAIEKQGPKALLIVLCALSIISFIVCFFIPLYSVTNQISYLPIEALGGSKDIVTFLTFIALFLGFVYNVVCLIRILSNFHNTRIYDASKRLVYFNFIFSIVYFLIGQFVCFINNLGETPCETISYIPFIITSVLMLTYTLFFKSTTKDFRYKKYPRIELLVYVIIFSILPLVCLKLNMLTVAVNNTELLSISGFDLLTNYMKLGSTYELQAFVVLAALIGDLSLLVLCLSAFFARNQAFYKLSAGTFAFNSIIVIIIGLFSKYYEIIQSMNVELIIELLESFNIKVPALPEFEVTSQTIFIVIGAIGLLMVVIISNPFKRLNNPEPKEESNDKGYSPSSISSEPVSKGSSSEKQGLFDPCAAFTEIDRKSKEFAEALEQDKLTPLQNPTLQTIAEFIVNYARDSRLHLSYQVEDIATFIAGLGATRLSILQGMSGTGKTSLPKIFLEALKGRCEIIEVESSWRDKNELLGYYNEFSKTYTPKKFTQALYRAKLNKDRITFIVLDEMNLSRIEYYFSDFLSLMENEEDKREIKLLNIPLYIYRNDKRYAYLGLTSGHTIKIPRNVWFIGTANRDESTFEISDKVYDRANTMNFNKRAPKVTQYNAPMDPQFLSYDDLINAINEAKSTFEFDIDSNETIKEVEKILAPYNISYGNRIALQIENFVKVYCSCFEDGKSKISDAVERILLSKVVAKLENKSVENKDVLIAQFNRLKLYKCSEFISKLNED